MSSALWAPSAAPLNCIYWGSSLAALNTGEMKHWPCFLAVKGTGGEPCPGEPSGPGGEVPWALHAFRVCLFVWRWLAGAKAGHSVYVGASAGSTL